MHERKGKKEREKKKIADKGRFGGKITRKCSVN